MINPQTPLNDTKSIRKSTKQVDNSRILLKGKFHYSNLKILGLTFSSVLSNNRSDRKIDIKKSSKNKETKQTLSSGSRSNAKKHGVYLPPTLGKIKK